MTTQRTILFVLAAIVALIVATDAGAATRFTRAIIYPFVVDITQSVPVEISAPVTLESGEMITVSAPVTINVQLRVSVDGKGVVKVQETKPQSLVLGKFIMARGVIRNTGEPLSITDTFDTNAGMIYAVAFADTVAEGTMLFARWYRNGLPIEDSEVVIADQDYHDTYVEFHLDAMGQPFAPGSYAVEILANGSIINYTEFAIK